MLNWYLFRKKTADLFSLYFDLTSQCLRINKIFFCKFNLFENNIKACLVWYCAVRFRNFTCQTCHLKKSDTHTFGLYECLLICIVPFSAQSKTTIHRWFVWSKLSKLKMWFCYWFCWIFSRLLICVCFLSFSCSFFLLFVISQTPLSQHKTINFSSLFFLLLLFLPVHQHVLLMSISVHPVVINILERCVSLWIFVM